MDITKASNDALSTSKPISPALSLSQDQRRRAFHAASRLHSEMSRHSNIVNREKAQPVAILDCNEITIGDLLGSGSFYHVAHVKGLDLDLQVADSVEQNLKRNRLLQFLNGTGRKVAIKFLRTDLDPNQCCRAAAGLVLEMNLLSSLHHPNIVRLLGVSNEGPHGFLSGKGYFICIDRLYGTLQDQMRFWREVDNANLLQGKGGDKRKARRLSERLKVAVNIASALSYLHSNNIVFRDINPTNIRFDENDVVKLIGFQEARELDESNMSEDGINYHLSGSRGKQCFQAPEVAIARPYNTKADVFSFTILLWQLCTLRKSIYPGIHHREDYVQRIVVSKERPILEEEWSNRLKAIITRGWSHDASSRPTMLDMQGILHAEVISLKRFSGILPPKICSQRRVNVLDQKPGACEERPSNMPLSRCRTVSMHSTGMQQRDVGPSSLNFSNRPMSRRNSTRDWLDGKIPVPLPPILCSSQEGQRAGSSLPNPCRRKGDPLSATSKLLPSTRSIRAISKSDTLSSLVRPSHLTNSSLQLNHHHYENQSSEAALRHAVSSTAISSTQTSSYRKSLTNQLPFSASIEQNNQAPPQNQRARRVSFTTSQLLVNPHHQEEQELINWQPSILSWANSDSNMASTHIASALYGDTKKSLTQGSTSSRHIKMIGREDTIYTPQLMQPSTRQKKDYPSAA